MADRLVTADASPLIGLAAAGGFDLLRKLFGQLTITNTVRDEVLAGAELPGAAELAEAIHDGWITVEHTPADAGAFADLDAGESSTLTLAGGHVGPSLTLLDDPVARSHANAHGLAVTGVAGVLLAAKKAGLVKTIRPFLERLAARDFRLSGRIVRAVLEQAGEA
jgi:predicted nucleic acid-binding protein